jgi:hypothetical protein
MNERIGKAFAWTLIGRCGNTSFIVLKKSRPKARAHSVSNRFHVDMKKNAIEISVPVLRI